MARTNHNSGDWGDIWSPNKDEHDNRRTAFDPTKDYIEGYYMSSESKTFNGQDKPTMVHVFRIHPDPMSKTSYNGFGTPDNDVTVFGSTVLDKQLAKIANDPKLGMGSWTRIEWKGMELKSANKKILDQNPNKQFTSNSDFVKLFDVISDDEIPKLPVAVPQAYTPAANNGAKDRPPAPKQEPVTGNTNIQAAPAGLGSANDDNDGLPF